MTKKMHVTKPLCFKSCLTVWDLGMYYVGIQFNGQSDIAMPCFVCSKNKRNVEKPVNATNQNWVEAKNVKYTTLGAAPVNPVYSVNKLNTI